MELIANKFTAKEFSSASITGAVFRYWEYVTIPVLTAETSSDLECDPLWKDVSYLLYNNNDIFIYIIIIYIHM